jgi:hypothetical protein
MEEWPQREAKEFKMIIALEVNHENAEYRRAQARMNRRG